MPIAATATTAMPIAKIDAPRKSSLNSSQSMKILFSDTTPYGPDRRFESRTKCKDRSLNQDRKGVIKHVGICASDHLDHQLKIIYAFEFDSKAIITLLDSLNVLYMNLFHTDTEFFRELFSKKFLKFHDSKDGEIRNDASLTETERITELARIDVIFIKIKKMLWG